MADIDTVRLLIADLGTGSDQLLTDAQITSLLDLEGSVKLAAAQALDAIASSEALVSKRITTQDLTTDGPATAKALREHAAALRVQAAGETADADEGYFEIVDFDPYPASVELDY